jgi:hypothetical protein
MAPPVFAAEYTTYAARKAAFLSYVSPHFYVLFVMAAYLAATCVSMLFSSHEAVGGVWLGGATGLRRAAYGFYALWFISVLVLFRRPVERGVHLHFRGGVTTRRPSALSRLPIR